MNEISQVTYFRNTDWMFLAFDLTFILFCLYYTCALSADCLYTQSHAVPLVNVSYSVLFSTVPVNLASFLVD